MARKSLKSVPTPKGRKGTRPLKPGEEDQATVDEFEREGMGVGAKE